MIATMGGLPPCPVLVCKITMFRIDISERVLAALRSADSAATPIEKRRVVRDGNLITAGGVTSGIDFGLEMVAEIAGEAVARSIQLSLEYDPDPPFDSGHPDHATAQTLADVSPRYAERRVVFRKGIEGAVAV